MFEITETTKSTIDLRSPMMKKLEAETLRQKEREKYVAENQFLLSGWRQKLLKNFNWTTEKQIDPVDNGARRYYRGEYK